MKRRDAIDRLIAYKRLHGRKLDAPWRKNPNINLLGLIDHWIELLGREDKEDVPSIVERRIGEMLTNTPSVCKVASVCLTESEIKQIQSGEAVSRQVVPGVIASLEIKHTETSV